MMNLVTIEHSRHALGKVKSYKVDGKAKTGRLLKVTMKRPDFITEFYSVKVQDVRPGDLLDINAQVEITNDLHKTIIDPQRGSSFCQCTGTRQPLFGIVCSLSRPNGKWRNLGPWASINALPNVHHVPLYATGYLKATKSLSGTLLIAVRGHARLNPKRNQCKAGPHLWVETDYGQITVRHYRQAGK